MDHSRPVPIIYHHFVQRLIVESDLLSEAKETSRVSEVAISQTVCTAIQLALAQLLFSWGFEPEYVIGHSSGELSKSRLFMNRILKHLLGEICAAYTAGHISAEEAIVVAYYRGQACHELNKEGAMLAVGKGYLAATDDIDNLGLTGNVRVACINSPDNVTISGDREQIFLLRTHYTAKGQFAKVLNTDGRAYHSHHMAFVGQNYRNMLASLLDSPAQRPLPLAGKPLWLSTVTGKPVTSAVTSEYWRNNLECPVEFSEAVQQVIQISHVHCVELGPHSALEVPLRQNFAVCGVHGDKTTYKSALSRGKSGLDTVLHLMGDLYLRGFAVPFCQVNSVAEPILKAKQQHTEGRFLSDLPLTRWSHENSLWNESTISTDFRNKPYPRHDILGSRQSGPEKVAATWRNILKSSNVPWLRDHKIDGLIVFPAAGYITMAVEAARQLTNTVERALASCSLQNIRILKALVLSDEESGLGVETYTTLHESLTSGESEKTWQFAVMSRANNETILHADGLITFEHDSKALSKQISARAEELEVQPAKRWYETMSQAGIQFSGPFRALSDMKNSKDPSRRRLTSGIQVHHGDIGGLESTYPIHPASLDAVFHASLIATAAGVPKQFQLRIPTSFESIRFRLLDLDSLDKKLSVTACANPLGLDEMTSSVELSDEHGHILMQVHNIRVAPPLRNQQEIAQIRHPVLRVEWKPDITIANEYTLSACSTYFNSVANELQSSIGDSKVQRMLGTLDLLAHKNPGLRILEVGNDSEEITQDLLDLLHAKETFSRCSSYAKCQSLEGPDLRAEYLDHSPGKKYVFGHASKLEDDSFDLALVFSVSRI